MTTRKSLLNIAAVILAVIMVLTLIPAAFVHADGGETAETTYMFDDTVFTMKVDGTEITSGTVISNKVSDTATHTITVGFNVASVKGKKWADHENSGVVKLYEKYSFQMTDTWTIFTDGTCVENEFDYDENLPSLEPYEDEERELVDEVVAGSYTCKQPVYSGSEIVGYKYITLTLNEDGTYIIYENNTELVNPKVYINSKYVADLENKGGECTYTYKITGDSVIAVARFAGNMSVTMSVNTDYGTSWVMEFPDGYDSSFPAGCDLKFIVQVKEGYRKSISVDANGNFTNLQVYCNAEDITNYSTGVSGHTEKYLTDPEENCYLASESDPANGKYVFILRDVVVVKSLIVAAANASLPASIVHLRPDYYTVNFYSDTDSSEPYFSDNQVSAGANYSAPADPVKDGYQFMGWYDKNGNKVTFPCKIYDNRDFYAHWEGAQKVTFVYNNGNDPYVKEVKYGETVSKPADPTLLGYTFTGWFTDEQLTNAYDFTKTVTADLSLYAGWERNTKVNTVRIKTQPADCTVNVGENAEFSVAATGVNITYQWYEQKSGETEFKAIAGMTGASASFAATAADNGAKVYCIVTDDGGNSRTTSTVNLTVNGIADPIVITQNPVSTVAVLGSSAEFTVAASGSELKYQWQYSTDQGKTWSTCSLTGSKTAKLVVTAASETKNYLYRCKVSDNAGNVVYSGSAQVTLLQARITWPQSSSKVLTLTALGTSNLKYQWQYLRTSGNRWYNTAANKAAVLSMTARMPSAFSAVKTLVLTAIK